jgi:lysophospholipase L1-like esterase
VFPYKSPTIPKNQSYRIVIVGDSIVAAMGANANVLRMQLKDRYPGSEFVTYNYGYPATNVLTLPDRLSKETNNGRADIPPILKQGFELIIIESFGNNPLSDFSLDEGLQKQTEILEESVALILKEKPDSALAFMTPIALSFENYARAVVDLNTEQRAHWVNERIAYIQNHKKFAEEKGIPVIDVYSASLKSNGKVDESYVSDDSVHPSKKGIELISREIADYIFENKIFPE